MRQFRLLILFAAVSCAAFAYKYPIKDVKGLHSASFAEMRPDHFHSGVDIKTDGRQGLDIILDAWGWCTGTTQRDSMGRDRKEHSGWGTQVYLWWIYFDI